MTHMDGMRLELMVVFTLILSIISTPSRSDSENSYSELLPVRVPGGLLVESTGELDVL